MFLESEWVKEDLVPIIDHPKRHKNMIVQTTIWNEGKTVIYHYVFQTLGGISAKLDATENLGVVKFKKILRFKKLMLKT